MKCIFLFVVCWKKDSFLNTSYFKVAKCVTVIQYYGASDYFNIFDFAMIGKSVSYIR